MMQMQTPSVQGDEHQNQLLEYHDVNDENSLVSSSFYSETESQFSEMDLGRLYELCVVASSAEINDDAIWNEIREWLHNSSVEERKNAMAQREKSLKTPLHEVCNHPNPPVDVIANLLACCPTYSAAKAVDSSSWIPLHIACNSEVSAEVIQLLVDAYPEGKTQQDRHGRTPLHFLLSKANSQTSLNSFLVEEESQYVKNLTRITQILTTTQVTDNQSHQPYHSLEPSGAEQIIEYTNNMLPIHYACVYGKPTSVIEVLVEVFPNSILATDRYGRTPLHYSMRNADNRESPQTIQLLVEQDPLTFLPRRSLVYAVDMVDNKGLLPIHLLGKRAFELEEQNEIGREYVTKCLNIYLDSKPMATSKFLNGLQNLPIWLKHTAVMNINVKKVLNQKIAERIPTMFLLLDALFSFSLFFSVVAIGGNILENYNEPKSFQECALVQEGNELYIFSKLLNIGMAYFLFHEILQMFSQYNLGNFKSYLTSWSNWTNIFLITLLLMLSIVMDTCFSSRRGLVVGLIFLNVSLAIKIFFFLKSVMEDFAVLVEGVLYVVKRLFIFGFDMLCVLLAFSQIFYLIYRQTDKCKPVDGHMEFAHCSQFSSLLRVYSYLMGDVDPIEYAENPAAIGFFMLYILIVIILLSNVLIAVVTDNYKVIQNKRAAMVFWSNRLDLAAQMDAISRLIFTFLPLSLFSTVNSVEDRPLNRQVDYKAWDNFTSLFLVSRDMDILMILTKEYWILLVYRVMAVFLIPLWFFAGFCSAGLLWPPQIRQKLVPSILPNARVDASFVIYKQVSDLRREVRKNYTEMKSEMKRDRQSLATMKTEAQAVQSDLLAEVMQIKEIMSTLLELRKEEKENMRADNP